jgi:hypothetical protein
MLDMTESGGRGPPTPESSFTIYRHQQRDRGLAQRWRCKDRSRFVSLTGIEVGCIDIIYHNTRTKQISSIMFWARHPDKF